MAIINYIPNVKTPTGFDTLNTVSQFTNHVATGVFTNVDTYEINVPAPNDILTGQFVVIFVPDTDSIMGMKISINNGTAIPIDGVGVGSLKVGVATSLLVNTIVGKAYMQVFGVKTPNKNLLHNWDFRNPVNQRGASSYSGAVYGIDRWIGTANAIVSVNSGSIRLTYGAGQSDIRHGIENMSLNIGTYTFSVKYKSDVAVRLWFSLNASVVGFVDLPASATWAIGSYTFNVSAVNTSSTFVSVQLNQSGYVDLESAKLELGSVSTLANDPPADYGEQLALCQRYCLKLTEFIRFMNVGLQSGTIDFEIPIPVALRTMPTIVGTLEVRDFSTWVAASGFTFTVAVLSNNAIMIRATKTAHGLTMTQLNIPFGGVLLSADL